MKIVLPIPFHLVIASFDLFIWKFLEAIWIDAAVIIAGIMALIIYNPIADLLHAPRLIVIVLLFIWQQVYMVFRMLLGLTLYAREVRLYHLVLSA